MTEEVSIKIERVSKMYRLYDNPAGRLKEALWRGRRSYHKEFWALRDVNFDVYKGTTIGVLGRNGSGKSTLLQLIAGIINPTQGSIKLSGRISALLELGSGFDPEFTGRENVYMNGAILGLNKEEINSRFEAIERFADIGDFIDQPVKLYSSGMFVRLAFATAVNVDPDILLVDEALSVGDVVFQHRCMSKIREIQERGKTIFFVTHDLSAVKKLCTGAVLLENGKMVSIGEPDVVIDEYNKRMWGDANGKEREKKQKLPEKPAESLSVKFEAVKKSDRRLGNGLAQIIAFSLTDGSGRKKTAYTAGDRMVFSISVVCLQKTDMPLASFIVKDLMGNDIFGVNTDGENIRIPLCLPYKKVEISFMFTLPHILSGSYAITAAFGNGTLNNPEAYDWIENICVFTVENPGNWFGLIKTDMKINYNIL